MRVNSHRPTPLVLKRRSRPRREPVAQPPPRTGRRGAPPDTIAQSNMFPDCSAVLSDLPAATTQ